MKAADAKELVEYAAKEWFSYAKSRRKEDFASFHRLIVANEVGLDISLSRCGARRWRMTGKLRGTGDVQVSKLFRVYFNDHGDSFVVGLRVHQAVDDVVIKMARHPRTVALVANRPKVVPL